MLADVTFVFSDAHIYIDFFPLIWRSRRTSKSRGRVPLPPPSGSYGAYSFGTETSKPTSFPPNTSLYPIYENTTTAPSAPATSWDDRVHSLKEHKYDLDS